MMACTKLERKQAVSESSTTASEASITIYTIGYRQTNAAEQIERLVAQGYHLIDIRMRAGSRYKAAYNLRQLCQSFGLIYHRLRDLGNVNYPHRPFVLDNQEVGIAKVLRILQMEQVKGIIPASVLARAGRIVIGAWSPISCSIRFQRRWSFTCRVMEHKPWFRPA